jgi:8-oxo-dGTP diphosphatase
MAHAHQSPSVTVDCIIELLDHPDHQSDRPAIVLIERRFAPLGWAIPGGFVDLGESLSHAAVRESLEETSLHVELIEQLFSYSAPDRDPRRHTISTVFVGRAHGAPKAADDARNLSVFTENNLPELAFDHAQVLADYFTWRRTGRRPPVNR